MKNIYFLFLALILFSSHSFGFGSDTKPLPDSTTFQEVTQVDVAFNGWVYEAFTSFDTPTNTGRLTIMVSKTGGEFWDTVFIYASPDIRYTAFDFVVTGTTTNDLKLFLSIIIKNLVTGNSQVSIDEIDMINPSILYRKYTSPVSGFSISDVAIATDYLFPASGITPFSIGMVYSKFGSPSDSIIYVYSQDGGINFNIQTVRTTPEYTRKVSISFGKSLGYINGRYFVAWEEMDNASDRTGHIYVSRNNITISDYFIPAVNLDSLDASMTGRCRNPKISVQADIVDNDSARITAFVLMERDYLSGGTDYDILGFYTMNAISNYWVRTNLDNDTIVTLQPDIAYDSFYRRFTATFFDSTNQKLPCVYRTFNPSSTSNSWLSFSANYSDHNSGLESPRPHLAMDPFQEDPVFSWSRVENGKGVAYFDSRHSAILPYTQNDTGEYCIGLPFTYNGTNYNAGNHTIHLNASNGLDSTINLTVIEHPLPTPQVFLSGNDLITQNYIHYQWLYNSTVIASANSQSYTATSDGFYSVIVTDTNGCIDSSVSVFIDVSGIDDLNALGIYFYPNPTSGIIQLDIKYFSNEEVEVNVLDRIGKVVLSKSILGTGYIDLSQLANGIYFLRFKNDSKSYVGRIVKE